MTIFIDDPLPIGGRFNNWCHMWTDGGVGELNAMADRLDLSRTWAQVSVGLSGRFVHYDLSPGKRAAALRFGAKYMPLKDWIKSRAPSK